jgi:hypothetical protein
MRNELVQRNKFICGGIKLSHWDKYYLTLFLLPAADNTLSAIYKIKINIIFYGLKYNLLDSNIIYFKPT